MSTEHRHMPDANRLSVLLSAVLLSYALAQLIETDRYSASFSLFGVNLDIPFNLTVAASLIATGLTASGMDWLLRGHPHYDGRATFQHWIMPALTAFALGVPLYNLPPGLGWWMGFVLGGVMLMLVLLAEYIALDSSDVRYPAASAGLMALAFALFTILTASLSYSGGRLALLVLAVFPAAGMVMLRAVHLRTGSWEFTWAVGGAFILTQLAAALHYWPLTPVQYGLGLVGPLYALTGLILNLRDEISLRRAGLEAGLGLAVFWAAAIFLRV